MQLAKLAAFEAGKKILHIYETDFSVETKSDDSPLTLADKMGHDKIVSFLKETNIPILSEEGKHLSYNERKDWKTFWLVDPLDGTKEFVKRNGEFTVNIALIHNGSPIMGVIYVPVKAELYFAMKDLGSYKISRDAVISDLDDLIEKSIKLPIEYNRENYVIVGSRSHSSVETEELFYEKKKEHGNVDFMAVGSSLKFCMVAEGKADAYARYAPTMEWDTGAGDAICRMAGFQVLQYNTDIPLRYNKKNLLNPWFLVT